jgi:hypothetical protein
MLKKNNIAALLILCLFFVPEFFSNNGTDYVFKVKFFSTSIIFILCIFLFNGAKFYLEMLLFVGVLFLQILSQILIDGYEDLLRPNLLFIIFTAFILIIVKSHFENNSKYKNEIFNKNLLYFNIIYFLITASQINSGLVEGGVLRAHTLIYLFIFCLVADIKINKFNLFIMLSTTTMLYLLSYASRVQIPFAIILLFLISRVLVFIFTVLGVLLWPLISDFFLRVQNLGFEDFGREYIYICYYEKFSSSNLFISNLAIFKPCNDIWGYSHSSHLELYSNIGLILYIFAFLSIMVEIMTNLLKKNYSIGIGLMFGMLFGLVEGGVEFIYFTSLILILNKCIMMGIKLQPLYKKIVS